MLKTLGQGERRAACPKCAAVKQRPRDDALAVKIDERGATWLCHRCGWTGANGSAAEAGQPTPTNDKGDSVRFALELWQRSRRIKNTLGERYYRARGIFCPLPDDI